MNSSKFVQTEGYPLTSERLQELQTTFQPFNVFGNLAGNLTIISGCETPIGSTTVKDGFVFINGELLEFREAAVDGNSTVIILEDKIYKTFKNGSSKEVYVIRYATIGTNPEASWLWSSFTRPIQTKNIEGRIKELTNKLTIVEDKLVGIETKLNGIEAGAQKNVQSDFNVNDTESNAYIKNRPAFLKVLAQGNKNIGNITSNSFSIIISFEDIGTANYQVLGTICSNSGNFNLDNNVFHNIRNRTSSSFRLCLREMSSDDQNISFDYTLIEKP